jgi:predicted acyl esterase
LKRTLVTAAAALVAAALAAPAAPAAEPQPLGHACTPQHGVRFCEGSAATRVPSFDGVPLDVDVTLPASGDGPFPTLVMMHGWGGDKGSFESTTDGGGPDRYDNLYFASRGWAVVNYSARGFGDSCGAAPSRLDAGCLKGWVHLADQRLESRDTQFLLGLLVDAGTSAPGQLAATGISYGGGQSLELAYLNDRTRLANGSFEPWKSPKGTPLKLAAAWPRWPWSDLASSLAPNGRFLDFRDAGASDAIKPVGIPKSSYTSGLYASGNASGFLAPPGVDPNADLTTWFAETNKGEPETQAQRDIVEELHTFHSAAGIPIGSSGVAPVLLQSGWTDDLFPAPEGLRAYNQLRAKGSYVALQLGDLGHARGQNKQATDDVLNPQGSDFLDGIVRKTGAGAPKAGTVTAMTQTCPKDAAPGGPFKAASWPALHPGAVLLQGGAAEQTVSSGGGDPQVAQTIDPIAGGGACAKLADADASGTAVYRLPVASPFTLLGLPIVSATIATNGDGGQLDSRLWDVGPDGQQILVARGGYRLLDGQKGKVVFQLWGNGYRFEAGHVAKLELLGQDSPYLRASNGSFSVKVSRLSLELPTREKPRVGQVVAPVLSGGVVSGGDRKQLMVAVTPAKVRAGRRVTFVLSVFGANCKTCSPYPLAGARVRFGGKTYKIGSGGQKFVKRRFKKEGVVRLRATFKGYPAKSAKVRVLKRK